MSQQSQFELLKSRRFGPYFTAQFLGALNDNLFKTGLLIIVAYGATRTTSEIGLLNNLAAGLFILPFFLFAMVAGQLADAYDKAVIIKRLKYSELVLALLCIPALLTQNVEWMLAILFGFGLQSSFFAPAKYSILPQHLNNREIVGGNALVQMGTFIAILVGNIVGGTMAATESLLPWLAGLIVLTAVIGVVAGNKVPPAPPVKQGAVKVSWNLPKITWQAVKETKRYPGVLMAIVAVSWFWFLGATILTQLPGFTKDVIGGDAYVVSWLLAIFSVGIGAGSLMCERISAGRIELGLVPMGALGMAIFGWQFATVEIASFDALRGPVEFFGSWEGFWVTLHVLLVGGFGGWYIVPLMAFVQSSTPEDRRGRTLAVNSLMNALFMVASAGFAILVLVVFEADVVTLLKLTALGNLVVLMVILATNPTYFLRMVMWILAQLNYRLNIRGRDNIPEEGPVLIVANHVTFIDWLFLGAACHRPIRFLMDKDYYDIPIFKPILKFAGAIPVTPRHQSQEAYEHAMKEMVQTLKDGKVLVIFPEGRLSSTGEMREFQRGFEKVLSEAPAAVVPAALHGLWGSFFSRRWGRAMSKPFRRIYSRVGVEFAEPYPFEQVSGKNLRLKIQSMLDEGMPRRER